MDENQGFNLQDPDKKSLEAELRHFQAKQMGTLEPKPWVELSIEEKIERTREQVKNLQQQTNYVMGRVEDAHGAARRVNHDLIEHRHDANDGGKVMLPAGNRQKELRESLDSAQCCGNTRAADPSKLYF